MSAENKLRPTPETDDALMPLRDLIHLYAEMDEFVEARTALRLERERDELKRALQILVNDVQDYESWQRPCWALDQARALLAQLDKS